MKKSGMRISSSSEQPPFLFHDSFLLAQKINGQSYSFVLSSGQVHEFWERNHNYQTKNYKCTRVRIFAIKSKKIINFTPCSKDNY